MNAREELSEAHKQLLLALEGISEQDTEGAPVMDSWTLHDVIVHLDALEHLLDDVISSQMTHFDSDGSGYLNRYLDLGAEGFAKFYQNEMKAVPYAELVSNLNSSHAHIMGAWYLLNEHMLNDKGTLPWYGNEYSLSDFAVNSARTKREITSKILDFKKHMEIVHHQPSKPT